MRDTKDILKQILTGDRRRLSVGEVKYTNKEDVDAILEAITDNPYLEAIALDNLKIAPQWLEQIVEAAASCPRIQELSLHGNPLPDKTAAILANSLRQWPELEVLRLGDAELSAQGIAPICEALQHKPKLRDIELAMNALHPAGAEEVADCIRTLPAIRTLDLSDCALGNDGLRLIGDALAVHGRNLVRCDMHYNAFSPEAAADFSTTLLATRPRNLMEPPIEEPALKAYCQSNLDTVKALIKALHGVERDPQVEMQAVPSPILAAIAERLPALEAKTHPQELIADVQDFLATLPVAQDDLFAADARGYTALDNPETWKHIADWPHMPDETALTAKNRHGAMFLHTGLAGVAEEVIPALNARGVGITAQSLFTAEGKATPLMQQLLDDGNAPLLFTAANWRGQSPQDMQQAYNMLPDEQREQVPNYRSLRIKLEMEHQPQRGAGR